MNGTTRARRKVLRAGLAALGAATLPGCWWHQTVGQTARATRDAVPPPEPVPVPGGVLAGTDLAEKLGPEGTHAAATAEREALRDPDDKPVEWGPVPTPKRVAARGRVQVRKRGHLDIDEHRACATLHHDIWVGETHTRREPETCASVTGDWEVWN